MRRSIGHGIALAAALTAAAGPAGAADDEALFQDALRAFDAGKYDEACPLFQESYALGRKPGALFSHALCEAMRGKSATAFKMFNHYVDVVRGLPPDAQKKQAPRMKRATEEIAKLQQSSARVSISLSGPAAKGLRVTIDDGVVPQAELSVDHLIDPGEHVVMAQEPGGRSVLERVVIKPGERRAVRLDLGAMREPQPEAKEPASRPSDGRPPGLSPVVGPVKPTPPPAPIGPAPRESVSARRVAGFVAGGVGAALLAVGVTTGAIVLARAADIKKTCPGNTCPDDESTRDAQRAQDLGLVSSIAIPAGAVGVAAGTVLLVLAPPTPGIRGKTGGEATSEPGGFLSFSGRF